MNWIIGGLAAWTAASTALALLIGAAIRYADCCDHPEAG